jgi:hypothetical protein
MTQATSKRLFGNDAFRLSLRQELFSNYYFAADFVAFEVPPLQQSG